MGRPPTMAAVQELAERVKDDSKVYVDTDAGVDDAAIADGSESKPYKTLAYAYIQNLNAPSTPEYLLRSSVTGPLAAGEDPSVRLVWKSTGRSWPSSNRLRRRRRRRRKRSCRPSRML